MFQTLQLISATQTKRIENIINNSRIIERDNKPLYFILNENKTKI